MARGGTFTESLQPPIRSIDDLQEFLRRERIYSFRSGGRFVLPSVVKNQPWELSVAIRPPVMDFIVPMQRLHPTLDPHDVAVLILNINSQLELPGFALNGSRRQVYLRLPVLLGRQGIAPGDVVRLIATASDTMRMYGRHFDYIGGDDCMLGEVAGDVDFACATARQREGRWVRLRDLFSTSTVLQQQRRRQEHWIGRNFRIE